VNGRQKVLVWLLAADLVGIVLLLALGWWWASR